MKKVLLTENEYRKVCKILNEGVNEFDHKILDLAGKEYYTDFYQLWLFCVNSMNVDKAINYLDFATGYISEDFEDNWSKNDYIRYFENIQEDCSNSKWCEQVKKVYNYCVEKGWTENAMRIEKKVDFLLSQGNNEDLYDLYENSITDEIVEDDKVSVDEIDDDTIEVQIV